MVEVKVKTTDDMNKVKSAASDAAFKNFRHAAASMSKDVKASLETAEGASHPGAPPHTHRGAYLRRAIRYEADGDSAIVGPTFAAVGLAGSAHEFGGDYKGSEYPARPFMGPALLRAIPRFAGSWQGSIGQ